MREYALGSLTFLWKFPLIGGMENATIYLFKFKIQMSG